MVGISLEIEDPRLLQFYDYWRGKCRDGRLPGRADIDPVEIPDLLPWVMLVDPVPASGGYRYRLRLVGTGIVAWTGRDSTGKWYDDILTPRDVARFSAIYAEIMATRQPHHYRADMDVDRLEGREHIRYERLMCPLAADGQTVDMLAGVMVFLDGPTYPRP